VWSSSNPPRASWEHPFGPLRPPPSLPPSPPSDRTTNPGGGASGGAGGAGASGSGAGGGGSPHNPPQAAVTPYAGSQQRQPLLVTNEHPVHAPGSRAYSPISSFQSQLNYGQPSANSGNPNWPPLNGLCHRIMVHVLLVHRAQRFSCSPDAITDRTKPARGRRNNGLLGLGNDIIGVGLGLA
jgi:hypothetical protein